MLNRVIEPASCGRLFCFPDRLARQSGPKRRSMTMKKLKLVMVGNGMAGVRTIEELLKVDP